MNIDDPKLTAYALGELSGPERAEIEKQLRDDPKARAFVEETMAFAEMLGNAFHAETPLELDPEQRAEVIRQASTTVIPFRLPRDAWWAGIGSLAASAAIALLFTWSMGPVAAPELADASRKEPLILHGVIASATPTEFLPAPPPLAAAAVPSLSQPIKIAQPLMEGSTSTANASQAQSTLAMTACSPNTYARATTVTSGTLTISTAPAAAAACENLASLERPLAMAKPAPAESDADSLKGAAPAAPPAPGGNDILVSGGQVVAMEAEPRVRGGATLAAPELSKAKADLRGLSKRARNKDADSFTQNILAPTSAVTFTSGSGYSIARLRNLIQSGRRPPADVIQIDALINAFQIGSANPLEIEVARCPWNDDHRLLCIRVKNTTPSSRLQVDFAPADVDAYHLIGGQPSSQAPGEAVVRLGSGPSAAILYEIVPARKRATLPQRLATVRVSNEVEKDPKTQEMPALDRDASIEECSTGFRIAASVAEFGILLQSSPDAGVKSARWDQIEQQMSRIQHPDIEGHRAELLELIRAARSL